MNFHCGRRGLVDVADREMHAVIPRLKMQVVKQKNKSFELVEKS
mgnify:CR=1 FL=1